MLPVSEVILAGEAEGHKDWAAWMRKRYRLGESQEEGDSRKTSTSTRSSASAPTDGPPRAA